MCTTHSKSQSMMIVEFCATMQLMQLQSQRTKTDICGFDFNGSQR